MINETETPSGWVLRQDRRAGDGRKFSTRGKNPAQSSLMLCSILYASATE